MASTNRNDEAHIYCTKCHAVEPNHYLRNGQTCGRTTEDGATCDGTLWIWREYRRRTRPPGPAQVIPFPAGPRRG